jgi:hypothetical protein
MKISFIGIASLLMLLLVSACKKQNVYDDNDIQEEQSMISTESNKADTVAYYTALFLKDTSFSRFFETTANNTLDIVSEVKSKCGVAIKPAFQELTYSYTTYDQINQFYLSHGVDTASMINKKADCLTSLVMLKAKQPDFFRVSESKRSQVIENVMDSLSNASYRNANSSDNSVIKFLEFYNRISNNGAAGRLTMDEVTECLKDALGGAVVGLASLATTIYGAVANTGFGWSTIRRIAKQALNSFWGGAVVVSVISFGWCILWDTID